MSKVVLVCPRHSSEGPRIQKTLERIHTELIPNNVIPKPSRILRDGDARVAVVNPVSVLCTHECNILLGHLVGESRNWWRVGSPPPDGAYCIFRLDRNSIELVTDCVASRTIWYVLTDEIFVASTSQRAIVMLLGSYEPNADAAVWMLSSGCLGPRNSWDSRIRCVEPQGVVSFDRNSWTVRIRTKPIQFSPSTRPAPELTSELEGLVRDVLDRIELDYSKFALPLSGGFDSRALLMMLREKGLGRCITWGREASQRDIRNDAYLAEQVARHFGVRHQFFAIDFDLSGETIENVLHRFLVSGEGRVARISGYTDGFGVWKELFEKGVDGVIRGDQLFGGDPLSGFVSSAREFDVRRHARLTILEDYRNLPDAESMELPSQHIDEYLWRRPGETLDTWRERTYQAFTMPVMMSGLTELKTSYVEVVSPLISRSIVEYCRILPDSLRFDHKFWHEFVLSGSPSIPFAQTAAPTQLHAFLRKREAVEVISAELASVDRPSIISSKLVERIGRGMEVAVHRDARRKSPKNVLSPFVPSSIRSLRRKFQNDNVLDINTFSFRAFIVSRMYRMLRQDAVSRS